MESSERKPNGNPGWVSGVAVLWGFAESVLFFLVPDVWTSIAGRSKLKCGLFACLYAVGGALVGGTVMYVWGANDLDGASAIVEKLPAINQAMVERVQVELEEQGSFALFVGPLRVTPYKVYSIHALQSGIGFGLFLLVSAISRLIRFVAITVFCHYALKLGPIIGLKVNPLILLVVGWIAFYTFYFFVMPN